MHWIYTLCLTFFLISEVWAGEIVLSGAYQGRDVFVRNPYNRSTASFCTKKVYVNDRLVIESPKVSAFKIDLSYLSLNDLVVIRIEHSEGCKPSIINAYVLKGVENVKAFEFLSAEVDNNSVRWSTTGETDGGFFEIQRKGADDMWSSFDKVNAKRDGAYNRYAVSARHKRGNNHYRIKYETTGGLQDYSLELYYTKTDTLITFRPLIATSQLTLSDSTAYKIYDYDGNLVKQGSGSSIPLLDLKPGEYYLEVQNRKEKFIKK